MRELSLTNKEKEKLNMAIAQKLSQLAKTWKKVQPIQPAANTVPDGTYICQLQSMIIDESKKSGRLQVVSTFMVADGEYENQTVKRFDGIDNETSMGYFKGYCEVLGVDLPEDLEQLQDSLNEFVESNTTLFEVVVKTNKEGYQNVYVNGPSDMTLEEEGEEEEQESQEEESQEEEQEEEEEEEEVKLPKKILPKSKFEAPVPMKKLPTKKR
jgi:hypothetical protein